MNWILGAIVIVILFITIYNYRKRKRKQQVLHKLVKNWGSLKGTDEFHFNSIQKYFKNNNQKNDAFHIISDRSAVDLDLDAAFKIIDRTSSKIGQQYLYYKFRTIGRLNKLSFFNDLTNLFQLNESLRLKTQLELSKINSIDSYYFEELVTSKHVRKPKIIWLIYCLSIMSMIFVLIGFFIPVSLLFLIPIMGVNMVFHYKNKWNISTYLDGVSQLSKVLKASKNIAEYSEVRQFFPDTGFIKSIEKLNLKTSFISFEKHVDNEFAILFWLVSEFIKVLFNLEYIIFYSFIDEIETKRGELEELFHFIGEIDSAISTASLKSDNYQLCNPIFTDEKNIEIKGIIHPLITNCVSNNLSLDDKSLLLTGSNMSGKTTFIKTVAINGILAQTLNICFAYEYKAPFFQFYSSIINADNLLENTSYYLEEVLIIKEFIEASKSDIPCLFVLDEIFKGTNTIERVSGGKAILSYLNKGNNVVLVSTHDIELADILVQEKFELYHFSEQIENNLLTFDHKIKKGKLFSRNAIKILELYEYPSEIIIDARITENKNFSTKKA